MKYLFRPDIQLYLIAFLLIAAGTIVILSATTDLYLVTEFIIILVSASFFILVEALIYFFTARLRHWRWLQYFHIATLFIFASFIILSLTDLLVSPGSFNGFNDFERENQRIAAIVLTVVFIFFAGQAAFLVNIITGAIRSKKNLAS